MGGGYDSSNWAKADTAGIFTNFINSTVQNDDTVYVASGHYKITSSINLITKSIKLYGGFSGNEKSIDDRDFTKNETIIDAQKVKGRRVFEIYTDSVIDGFTITGGKDNANSYTGAIYISDSSPEINNCIIADNETAILIAGASPTITNCTITGNNSPFYAAGFEIEGGKPIINKCIISNNTGRGIWIDASSPYITNCTISNNIYSPTGSGGIKDGGGIYYAYASSSSVIDNCKISENSATKGNGGGIYIDDAQTVVIISNCTITSNDSEYGGGIIDLSSKSKIINCTIEGNFAKSNGGGYLGMAHLINCTILNNTANGKGNEIYSFDNTEIINTLIWNESADNIIYADSSSKISFDHCALPENFAVSYDVSDTAPTVTNDSPIYISGWTPVSSEVTINGVTHTVYTLENNPALNNLKGNGIFNENSELDQLGTVRHDPPTIGAVEVKPELLSLNLEISADKEVLSLDVTSEDKIIFSPVVNGNYDNDTSSSLENYEISWNALITPANEKINFENGILSVSRDSKPGSYDVEVSADVTFGGIKTSAQKSVKVIINEIPGNPSKPSDEKKENEKDKDIINPDIPDTTNKSDDKKPDEQEPNNSLSKDNEIFYSVSMDLSNSESSDIDLSTLPDDVKSVDFSGSEKLKTLSLKGSSVKTVIARNCTNLESIDIAGNTSIEYLNISHSNISYLNVSGCTNLHTLLFSSCKVNENTFIYDGCENLKILAFNKNRFSQFDYNENELPSLEEFSCDSQKIDRIWKPSQNFSFSDDISISASNLDSANFENVYAEDFNGQKLNLVSFNGERREMEFDGTPAKIAYDYNTGFEDDFSGDYYMNVTITNSLADGTETNSETESQSETISDYASITINSNDVPSSGAGCKMLSNGLLFLIVSMLIFKPKRRGR